MHSFCISAVVRLFFPGRAWIALPVLGVSVAQAQIVVEPLVLSRSSAALMSHDLPAPALPEHEPSVGLAAMVVALWEAVNDGAIEPEEPAAREWRAFFAGMLDDPIMLRVQAQSRTEKLLGLMGSRELARLMIYVRKRDHSHPQYLSWLGGDTPTLNPFYNPESLPGWAARELIVRLEKLHPGLSPAAIAGAPAALANRG